jgi:hypothetical protein
MELPNRPVDRLPRAEVLENRCLLAAAPLESGVAGAPAVVQVVELEFAEDEHHGGGAIDPSALPAAVLAAFGARFPEAEITGVEVDSEDDELRYNVFARVEGRAIDATLTSEGAVVEVEEAISTQQLPAAVLNWLRSQYPGAQIDETAIEDEAGEVKYEVAFRQPGGQPVEVTLSVHTPAATDAANTITEPPESATVAARSVALASVFAAGQPVGLPHASAYLPESLEEYVVSLGDDVEAIPPAATAGDVAAAAAYALELPARQAKLLAETVGAVVAGSGHPNWMPELAGILTDIPLADAASVGRALHDLRRLLAQVDARADDVADNLLLSPDTTRLLTAALLFATVRLLFELRKPKQPVLAPDVNRASWSWILGAPRRRRGRR